MFNIIRSQRNAIKYNYFSTTFTEIYSKIVLFSI